MQRRRAAPLRIQTVEMTRLNYYRLKPVGLNTHRELRTEVLRTRLRNLKVISAIARFVAVLGSDVFDNRFISYIPA